MKIDKSIIRKWKILRSKGDINELASLGNVTVVTIRSAFNGGECSEQLFKIIGEFYQKRMQLIKKYI